jgi:hypothetical protein
MVVSCSFTFGEANYNSLPCRSKTNHERSTGLSDDDAHGMASAVFGGDDFGVDMPVSWLALFAKHKKESDNFRVQISATEVRLLLDI